MANIYVTGMFKQVVGDEIIGEYGSFVEISTETPEFYEPWLSPMTEEEVFTIKLYWCGRLRVNAYEQLNQNELMYDDKINGTNTWVEAITAIKAEFPKPMMRPKVVI